MNGRIEIVTRIKALIESDFLPFLSFRNFILGTIKPDIFHIGFDCIDIKAIFYKTWLEKLPIVFGMEVILSVNKFVGDVNGCQLSNVFVSNDPGDVFIYWN